MFGNWNGSLRARRRGWRNALTSFAPLNLFRFSNSTMHGSPQTSLHVMLLFASAHGGAMIQSLSKFFGERSRVEGGVHLGIVIEANIHLVFPGCIFSAGK